MRTPALLLLLLWMSHPVRAGEWATTIRDQKGEPVADMVVALIPLDPAGPVPVVRTAGTIAQESQEFTSYVTVVQAGATVVFPNQDTVQHHVYSLSKAKKFELPLYNPGQAESFVFDVSGVVTLGCNIHDWMIAYLYVVPTPYFTKTDSDGTATVTAPAGRYRLELMHPRLTGKVTEEITLDETAAPGKAFTVTIKPDRRIRRGGPAGFGGY